MNIFETKSKYFKNDNSKFAKMFSTTSITIVLILVGIVVIAMSIHGCLDNSNISKLTRNTKQWLTSYGFTYRGLEFCNVVDEDAGTYKNIIRYNFTVKEIYHKQLNDGKKVIEPELHCVILVVSAKYDGLAVQNIGLTWWIPAFNRDPGWIVKVSFDDWFHYMGTKNSDMPVLMDSYDGVSYKKFKDGDTTSESTTSINIIPNKSLSPAERKIKKSMIIVPVLVPSNDTDNSPSQKGIEGCIKDLNKLKDSVSSVDTEGKQEQEMLAPSKVDTEPSWDS